MRTIDPFSKKVQFKGRIFLAKNFQGGETVNFSEKARAMRMKSPLTLREIGERVLFGILTFLLIFLLLLYLDATHGAWGVIRYIE